jgi:hypothetical protein
MSTSITSNAPSLIRPRGLTFNTAVSLSLFLLVVGYWLLRTRYDDLLFEHRLKIVAQPKAYLLAGYQVRLEPYTSVLNRSANSSAPSGRRLVIVSSDTCPTCVQSEANWQKLMKDLRFSSSDEVVLVTLNSTSSLDSLPPLLTARSVSWRLLRVVDQASFIASTGFSGTPFVAVLSGDSHVRMVVRQLTPMAQEMLAAEFSSVP